MMNQNADEILSSRGKAPIGWRARLAQALKAIGAANTAS